MNFINTIQNQIVDNRVLMKELGNQCMKDIAQAAELVITSIQKGGKILWCGNGGSAAQAQHFSTELMGSLRYHERSPISSISLTTDSSLLTAWSNDISFETVFHRQVEALGKKGDVLIAISTSGNSTNVVKAVTAAKQKSMKSVILTGKRGGKLNNKGDICIKVPSNDTQRIQEGHLLIGHIICELVEKEWMKSN